jgi:hypothetical protein
MNALTNSRNPNQTVDRVYITAYPQDNLEISKNHEISYLNMKQTEKSPFNNISVCY